MLNINQQENARFIKKVATAKGFTRVGGGMGWGDRMGLGERVTKINLHSVNFTRAQNGAWRALDVSARESYTGTVKGAARRWYGD